MSLRSNPTKFFRFQWVSSDFVGTDKLSIDCAKAVIDIKNKAIKEIRMHNGLGVERQFATKSARQKSTICVIIKKDLQTI